MEEYRPHLFALAYRMLGSAADAEDIVQETFLRYQKHASPVESPKAFLTTIASRLCLDQLKSARHRRETYPGPWLPEPVVNPEEPVELQESIEIAFLLLLEQLQPLERAVFLLREVFAYEFAEIAALLGKTEANCRRSFSRARDHLRQGRPRFRAQPEEQGRLLRAYARAVQDGDLQALLQLLSQDVVLWTDGGGRSRTAALRPIHGPDHVARMSLGTRKFWPQDYQLEFSRLNGRAGLLMRAEGQVHAALTLEGDGEQIRAIWIMVNPEKLSRIQSV